MFQSVSPLGRLVAAALVLLFVLAHPLAAEQHPLTCAELAPRMHTRHISDLAIAQFHTGQVTATYCSSTKDSLSPASVFQAASLSKPVFAIGVLSLVNAGKLDLDRPLSTYLNQPYAHRQTQSNSETEDIVLDPRMQRVTARMVLSHTTGLPNWARNKPLTFLHDPGQQWSYSGEAYLYLQFVLEYITNQPLDLFLRDTVLTPLGMTHSSFVWQEDFASAALPGHTSTGAIEPRPLFLHPLASSSLYTTLDDYVLFVSSLMHSQSGNPAALAETRQVTVRPDLKLAWGLGLAIEETPPRSYFHWGANPGFQSFFLCQPSTHRAVLYLTDSDNGLDLVDFIVRRTVPGTHPSLRFPMLHPKD